jgi:hypothetical protein
MRKRSLTCALLLFLISFKSFAVDLQGDVATDQGTPLCALVLASGKSVFSCNPSGPFLLKGLPLESDGTIKLQVYADGFLPFAMRITDFGYQSVVMTRAGSCPVDDGLSDRSPLDGTFSLIRGSLQFNVGFIIDSYQSNVSTSGTMTIAGNAITQLLTLTVNGQSNSVAYSGTFEDYVAGVRVYQPELPLPTDVTLIERGSKVVTFLNNNYLGGAFAEVDQWEKVSGPTSIQAASVESQNYMPSSSPPGGLLAELLQTYGLRQVYSE